MGQTGNSVYIPSLDGKDIYLSNHYIDSKHNGYRLKRADGSFNLNKFCNTLDYSLDLIKVRDVFKKVYSHEARESPFSFFDGQKEFTDYVINVTFKYSVKEFNRINSDTYVRNGYCLEDLDIKDCVCVIDGQVVAIQVDHDVRSPCLCLPSYFIYIKEEGDINGHYSATGGIPTLLTVADIRRRVYSEGFICNGRRYVRFKRSAGSARVGKCLFIAEKLYSRMHTWEKCGLTIRQGQKIDLAAWESYIALTASSIIDTMELQPENILVIDDYKSKFKDRVMATNVVDGHLVTTPEEIDVENSIWDGQSLIDVSAMGEYSKYGMLLLRNRFFKSCCFNTNLQQWFADHGITEVSQLNGQTRAARIEDVKLVTTPSSIKYLKFGTLDQWLDHLEPTFGIVKHEKKTHFVNGEMVQCHYQLLNTLQMSRAEVAKLVRPSVEYITALRDDPAVLRNHLKFSSYKPGGMIGAANKNDVIYSLMNLNDKFTKTKVYAEFARTLVKSQYSNLRCGHVLVNGNYSTLLGNPIEMLFQTIGCFDGTSQLGVGHIHSTRFQYNRKLLMSRSPHVTIGNLMIEDNVPNELIDKYMNVTEEICCMNSINENSLARLSGSDFDSDTALLTDNDLLIEVGLRNYSEFLVPTSLVSADKINRYFTDEQKADLDIKTSVNKIGEIINFSQILNSILWNNLANGETLEENLQLYADIAQLDVMSNIEIDKAKKVFEVDNVVELKRLKEKYVLRDEDGLEIRPYFFEHISKKKGYYIDGKKNYKVHQTTMDYLQEILVDLQLRTRRSSCLGDNKLVSVLDTDMYNSADVDYRQVHRVVECIREYRQLLTQIWSKNNIDMTMNEKIILADRANYDVVYELSRVKFNYCTAYYLMRMIDMDKESKDIRNLLFYTLLSLPVNEFYEVFDKSQEDIVHILHDDHHPDCTYYGRNYRHYRYLVDKTYEALDKDELPQVPNFNKLFAKYEKKKYKNVTSHKF